MRRSSLTVLSVALALSAAGMVNAKSCKDPVTHRFTKCPAPAAALHHPDCKKGKLCGDACIAKDKICHK